MNTALNGKVADLVYRLDNQEIYRNIGDGDLYPEPMFAILNYAKITESEMEGEWTMEVDWVKHEKRNSTSKGRDMNNKSFTTRVALIVALGGFLMGFDASVISGVNKFVQIDFKLTDIQLGFSVGSLTIVAGIGYDVLRPIKRSIRQKINVEILRTRFCS